MHERKRKERKGQMSKVQNYSRVSNQTRSAKYGENFRDKCPSVCLQSQPIVTITIICSTAQRTSESPHKVFSPALEMSISILSSRLALQESQIRSTTNATTQDRQMDGLACLAWHEEVKIKIITLPRSCCCWLVVWPSTWPTLFDD